MTKSKTNPEENIGSSILDEAYEYEYLLYSWLMQVCNDDDEKSGEYFYRISSLIHQLYYARTKTELEDMVSEIRTLIYAIQYAKNISMEDSEEALNIGMRVG